MLKLTAFCPPDQTDAVVSALREDPKVYNVVRLPGVDLETGGDMVTAFVGDEAVDDLLARLRAVREWQATELSFIHVDLIVRHDLARLDPDGGDEDEGGTIGLEMMQARAQEEARLSWHYLTFMACAGLIAALGLVKDMPILIVGAMSLSPDLAPANAVAVDLTVGAFRRMGKALWTLVAGLAVGMLVAFVITLVLQALGAVEMGIDAVSDPMTAYVTVVAPMTVAVAVLAGVAAMVAFVTDQGTTAVGVAISVTTIPAAAYAGVALASGEFSLAVEALRVLVVNVVFLVLAQVVTLAILRAWKKRKDQRTAAAGSEGQES